MLILGLFAHDKDNSMEITLLTRSGCPACEVARRTLERLVTAGSVVAIVTEIDVDVHAEIDPTVRAEFGDRLPVVLVNGEEHSYGEVDSERLMSDCAG